MHVWLERAKRGDLEATRAVVEPLRVRVTRMAAFYARRCGEDPDDLLQEAWLGLLEALPALDAGIGSPEQYLIQRARWRMLDAVRRARARICLRLDDVESLDRLARIDEAPGAAEAAAFTRELSVTQRAVLECLMAGLTWREAGRALGCTSANIAYHVRQIRRRYENWRQPQGLAPAAI